MGRVRLRLALATAGTVALAIALVGAPSAGRADASGAERIAYSTDRGRTDPASIYRLTPGKAPRRLTRGAAESGLATSSSLNLIAFFRATSRGTVVVVARADGSGQRVVSALRPFGPDPGQLAFAPDGRSLLVAGPTGRSAFVDTTTLAVRRPPGARCFGGLAWSPDGRAASCDGYAESVLLDRAKGTVLRRIPGLPLWTRAGLLSYQASPASTLLFDADGRRIAKLSGTAVAWSRPAGLLALQVRSGSARCARFGVVDPLRPSSVRWVHRQCDATSIRFAPDGRYLAIDDLAYRLDGRAGRRPIEQCTWSPDGKTCAFLVPSVRGYPPTVRVFVGDRFGGGRRLVGRLPYDERLRQALAFAGGSRTLLFQTGQMFVGNDLRTVGSDGSGNRDIGQPGADQRDPAWSPDGATLAYAGARGLGKQNQGASTTIWRVAASGADRRQLTTAPTFDGAGHFDGKPTWSPDGTQVAFQMATVSSTGVAVVGRDGGTVTVLSPLVPDTFASLIGWLPDGSGVLIEEARRIVFVARDGLTRTPVLARAGARVLSRDGALVAIVNNQGLSLVTLDGSRPPVRVADDPHVIGPAFSPNGRELAYVDGGGRVSVAPLDGSRPPRAVARCRCVSAPAFSADSERIAYSASSGYGNTAIFVVKLAGGADRRITPGDAHAGPPAWQP